MASDSDLITLTLLPQEVAHIEKCVRAALVERAGQLRLMDLIRVGRLAEDLYNEAYSRTWQQASAAAGGNGQVDGASEAPKPSGQVDG